MNNDTVGLTSKISAAARGYESVRSDALFTDVFAPIYAYEDSDEFDANIVQIGNEIGRGYGRWARRLRRTSYKRRITNALLRSRRLRDFKLGRIIGIDITQIYQDVAVRTRFLDDIIQENIPNVKQIVLLACGGDFRPYRLPFLQSMSSSLDLTFYLLDIPHVLKYRQNCFAQLTEPATTSCNVVEVASDLSNDEWGQKLREAGFAVDQPTLWLAEGFFHYLNEEQIGLLFNRIQQLTLSKQTSIVFDLVSSNFQSFVRYAVPTGLFHFALDDADDVNRIFSRLGCYDIECTSFEELGRIYDRNVSRDRSFVVQARMNPVETEITFF
jgi:methyltransferase (TIGR00027 family)